MTKEVLAKKSMGHLVGLLREMSPEGEHPFRPLVDVILRERENAWDIKQGEELFLKQAYPNMTGDDYEAVDYLYRVQCYFGFKDTEIGLFTFLRVYFMDRKEFEGFKNVDDIYKEFGYENSRDFAEKFSLSKKDAEEVLAYAKERKEILSRVRYIYFILSLIQLIYSDKAE